MDLKKLRQEYPFHTLTAVFLVAMAVVAFFRVWL